MPDTVLEAGNTEETLFLTYALLEPTDIVQRSSVPSPKVGSSGRNVF